MKRKGKIITIILIILSVIGIFVIGGGRVVNAGSFTIQDSEIERVSTTVNVLDNDTVLVSERFYYNTDDINGIRQSYSYGLSRNETIEIESVFVDGVKSTLVPSAHNGDSGMYTFRDNGEEQELKIYQRTKGETSFTINYRVHGLIKQYNDVQDFDWKIFDATKGSTPLKLDATITFPTFIQPDQLQVFGHGDVEGTVSIEDGHTVKVDIAGFYEDTFAEVRVLLPGNPIPNVMNKSDEAKLDSFLEYERAEAEKTNERIIANGKKQNNTNLLLIALPLLWIAAIIFFFWILILFYRKYDAEQYKSELEYYRDVPVYSPAVAARVLDSDAKTTQSQLIATIFSLYTKKVINLSDLKKDVSIELLKKPSDIHEGALAPDESTVYQWLWDSFGEKGKGTYKEFFNIGKRTRASALAFERNFTAFENTVLHEYRQLDFEQYKGRDAKIPMSMRVFAFIFIGCMALVGIWQVFGEIHTLGFVVMIILTFLFFFAFGLLVEYKNSCYQLSEEGAKQNGEVSGLKKYLNDYSLLKEAEPTAVHLWEKYFVYGLALGVSKKALNKLYQRIPQAMQESTDWQTIYMMNYLSHNYNIVQRSENAVNSMATITGAAITRSSGGASFGGGGGFSGGGGFGSGGTSSGSF